MSEMLKVNGKGVGIDKETQILAARLADVETNYTNLKKELDDLKKKVGG